MSIMSGSHSPSDVPPGTMLLSHLHRTCTAAKRGGGCYAAMLQLKQKNLTQRHQQWDLQSLVMQSSRPAQQHVGTPLGHPVRRHWADLES